MMVLIYFNGLEQKNVAIVNLYQYYLCIKCKTFMLIDTVY